MKLLKYVFSLIIYFIFSLSLFAEINFSNDFNLNIKKKFSDMDIKLMYTELCLNDKVSFSCFNNAMHGLEKIEDLEIFDNSNNKIPYPVKHNIRMGAKRIDFCHRLLISKSRQLYKRFKVSLKSSLFSLL